MRYINAFGWTEDINIESDNLILIHGKDIHHLFQSKQNTKKIILCETADIVIQDIIIPQWVYKLYSTNLNIESSRQCCAIPYGILPRQYSLIQSVNKEKTYIKKHLLYLNFNTDTHRNRSYIYSVLKNKSFIYDRVNNQKQKENTDEGYLEYYTDIIESKFVLCPRGNGIDTYRMWETLYLGSFPVVEKSLFTSHFRNKLPILEIDNWNNINEEFLEEQHWLIKSKWWNIELLDKQYWINIWKKDIQQINLL